MAEYNLSETTSNNGGPEGRVRGSRRQKMYGYLKAANELRQSYQAQAQQHFGGDEEEGIPGAFPDVEIIRSGDEEMVLFPSYARKHIKKHPATLPGAPTAMPGSNDDIENPDSGDAEYWKREWEKYEDDNAVVDVDVRGWIYSPHREPINRKNRLLLAVARKLSGIPAPAVSPGTSNPASSDHLSQTEKLEAKTARNEEEAAAKAARSIVRKGETEAKIAWHGGYSEDPNKGYDSDSPGHNVSKDNSRSVSPMGSLETLTDPRPLRHSLTDTELASGDEDPGNRSLVKRRTWNHPSSMGKEELAQANTHLMARLKPFMTIPLANTAITIFFFNNQKSQSRSLHTNEAGHFNIRASLDFVPTSIRVLASEKLSATEKVIVTEDKGISLVSDIDDTIKHSAISSGAREIFKNTFIRDLSDLTIQGVKEWYTKMADLGVKLHFVSNSPWQLYPLLRSYFSLAGLPQGSFHLKHYTGMLQGIFEPAAERKRGSLERIMHDFPERKFILVGDSGEADLEVYSDVVINNPGRVLAVYIRDVTTPEKKKFFDQGVPSSTPDSHTLHRTKTHTDPHVSHHSTKNIDPPVSHRSSASADSPMPHRNGSHNSAALEAALHREIDSSDDPSFRPELPRRHQTAQVGDLPEADLIDFNDEPEAPRHQEPHSHISDLLDLQHTESSLSKPPPPARPQKPSSLRGVSTELPLPSHQERVDSIVSIDPNEPSKPEPPPKPRRPSGLVELPTTRAPVQSHYERPIPHHSDSQHPTRPIPPSHTPSTSKIQSLRPHLHKSKTVSSKLPTQSAPPPPDFYAPDYTQPADDQGEGFAAVARRHVATAYNALPTIRSVSPAPENNDPNAVYNKKLEIWKHRWAQAEELMHAHGVVLRSWRVGGDVMDECISLVSKGMEDLERESGRRGGVSLSGTSAHRKSGGAAVAAEVRA